MNADSYEHLAERYDAIFRLNPDTVAFLEAQLGGLAGRRIVDAGCGTGTLALELAGRGAEVLGVDLDGALLVHARAKATGAHPFRVLQADMCAFPAEPNSLEGVLCLGNTLVHLPDPAAVLAFLRHARAMLVAGGAAVVQTVNYDRVLDQGLTSLPTLEGPGWRFERHYAPEGDRIRFITLLTEGALITRGEHRLLPLRGGELDGLARDAGFTSVDLFGGFDGRPFGPEAPALVAVLRG